MLLQPCSVSSFPRCSVEVQLRRDLSLVRVRQRMVVVVTMMLRRRCEWSEWIWMVDNGRRVEQNGTNMMPSMEFSIVLPRSGHPFFHIFPFATASYGVGSTFAGEYLCTQVPIPPRDFTSSPVMIIIRSFDVNKREAQRTERLSCTHLYSFAGRHHKIDYLKPTPKGL